MSRALYIGFGLYWVAISVIMGLYIWKAGVDIWTNLMIILLVLLGIGFGVVLTGQTSVFGLTQGYEESRVLRELRGQKQMLEEMMRELKEIRETLEMIRKEFEE